MAKTDKPKSTKQQTAKQQSALRRFPKTAQALKNYDLTKQLSPHAISLIRRALEADLTAMLDKMFKSQLTKMQRDLTAEYRKFKQQNHSKHNLNIKQWRMQEISTALKTELKRRIKSAIALISPRKQMTTQGIILAMQGILTSKPLSDSPNIKLEGAVKKIVSEIDLYKKIRKEDKHFKMTLADQTRKMIGNFDSIVAEKFGAIAFIWNSQVDSSVVGNPKGFYPKVSDPKMHGDHYHRNGKLFYYSNNQTAKDFKRRGYFSDEVKPAKFEDGMPGQPINCRCFAENIYRLKDIPDEFLTEKGISAKAM